MFVSLKALTATTRNLDEMPPSVERAKDAKHVQFLSRSFSTWQIHWRAG